MAFKLNIGKEGGGGFSLFSKKQTQNMHDMKAGAAYQGVLEQNLSEVDKKQYDEYYRKVEPMANMNVPGPQYTDAPTAYRTPALQTGADEDDELSQYQDVGKLKPFVDEGPGDWKMDAESVNPAEGLVEDGKTIVPAQKGGAYESGETRDRKTNYQLSKNIQNRSDASADRRDIDQKAVRSLSGLATQKQLDPKQYKKNLNKIDKGQSTGPAVDKSLLEKGVKRYEMMNDKINRLRDQED